MTRHPEHPVIELLRTRRSPKLASLTTPGPGEDQIAAMLTIASRVPDHGKLVPWRFIVIAGDRRHDLGRVIGEVFDADNPAADALLKAEARRRLAYAPLVIAVVFCPRCDPADAQRPHPKVPEWEQVLSAGAACMNLLIAAKAMGYGGTWLTEWYGYDRRVLSALGLLPQERLAGFVHVGTEPEPREDRTRPPLSEIVSHY
ncbi:MAG: nitroreductase [Pyrinomonadaceae bacterium]|nr:nitroreductase [Phycisphaerales bacterium]